MDQPGLRPEDHAQALHGLERINLLSDSAGVLWPRIRSELRRSRPRQLRLLDVACGAGDVAVRLWRRANRAGLGLNIDGCDRSPTAVAHARRKAREAEVPVRFFERDAVEEALPAGYDILISSLFLHHLDDEQAVRFLREMARAAGQLVLINDLARGVAGYYLALLGTRLLSASPIVRTDGPRSVEAAFALQEVRDLAERAGLRGARVIARFPFRFLLSWRRP